MAQRHMDRLSSFDTSFLANEKDNAHMAIGAVLVFDGTPPAQEDFLALIRSRLHLLPRLRQRLLTPPLGLGTPFWVDDETFDVHRHVARATLPAPGTDAELRALAGQLLAPPLDRRKPLWELTLVDGFAAERFAVVYKTHHAMADGISAVDIGMLLFDVEPRTEVPTDEEPWRPHRSPSGPGLGVHAATGVIATVRRLVRWLAGAARDPADASRRVGDGLIGLWEVTWNLLRAAPRVPINPPAVGPGREFAWATFDLPEFKRIKNALGGTVNDVSLAVAAGALRAWFAEQEIATDLELKALVPVSIRTVDEHGELGNKLTAMRGPLPIGLADPAERLRTISTAMDSLKSSKQPLGAEAIWGLNDWFRDFAPPVLLGPTAAINFSPRLFNLLVTNFPGPQIPFYALGRELVAIHPVGFLAHRHGLAIAILSYNGRVSFGLLADPDSAPDIDRLAAHLDAAVAELGAAADRAAPPLASPGDGDQLAGDDRPRFARARERRAADRG
ncbi:MAG TPA: wax ester/triacylglycerol synthase family O-acyltransferase [Solirubrobacterales bacterium]|jgi:WS/DGAT/MGAT family acyltransferase|nr:wax ester/triacylglycerol synthase family O-acyltransferase [Solirubrobacterales bacterium]